MQASKLGKLAIINMGQSPLSSSISDDENGLPFLQGNAEFNSIYPKAHLYCRKPLKICEKDDSLISVRAPVGALNKADQAYCIGRGLAAIQFSHILPSFGWHLLCYCVKDLQIVAQGSTFDAISKTDLENLSLPYPPDDKEQQRIAHILNTIDTNIQQTEQFLAKLKQIKTGLLHDLLTRGINEVGEVRDPVTHHDKFKKSVVGKIPCEWDILQIDQVGTVQLGRQRSPKYQTGRYTTPYLRVANVFDGWIDYSDVLQMDFKPDERAVYDLLPGDILLNEGQSLELVGRSAIYKGPPNTYCFQNTLVRFRCNSFAVPEYCQAVFKYWLDTGKFTTVAKQTTSVAHLGADRFAKMNLFLPSPQEQQRIAVRLSAQDECITVEEVYLNKLRQIKKGLMHDLLTGQVHITPGTIEIEL